jgi:hypothetical protein
MAPALLLARDSWQIASNDRSAVEMPHIKIGNKRQGGARLTLLLQPISWELIQSPQDLTLYC